MPLKKGKSEQKQSIEHFRKQAKSLHRKLKDGDSLALDRACAIIRDMSRLTLAKAQHIVAVEHGFFKWDDLLKAITTGR